MVEVDFMAFMAEQLKDPALKAEYDALEPEYAVAQKELDARVAAEAGEKASSHRDSSLIRAAVSAAI